MGIYAIRTTANKEKNVASKLADRVEKEGYNISSIIVSGLKSYILVEGDRADIDKAYRGVAHARGLVSGEAKLDEIQHFLKPKLAVTNLVEGYIVEVISGPFKGEKARITRIDTTKNEITIELLEATIAIPITVPAESVRVLEKVEPEVEEKETKGDLTEGNSEERSSGGDFPVPS
jgi:transcriptional antiterminator NusG